MPQETTPSKYLEPVIDGLKMRDSQDYAKDKLRILRAYVYRFTTSMRNKLWRSLHYIDLQAGPGKNQFRPSESVDLGSPLIALTTKYPFSRHYFVEKGDDEFNALYTRITASQLTRNTTLLHGDCNQLVDQIVQEISAVDSAYIQGKWPSLNLAFLDPEGLELEWATVEKLAKINRMDLIINFSTSGFTRNAEQMLNSEHTTKLDSFFGTLEWKDQYRQVVGQDATKIRRVMLNFYQDRLKQLGYVYNYERDILPDEKAFRNQKGAQVYTLMFASKHELGIQFWNDAIQEVSQPKLF